MGIVWPWTKQPKSKIVWIDLGDLGDLVLAPKLVASQGVMRNPIRTYLRFAFIRDWFSDEVEKFVYFPNKPTSKTVIRLSRPLYEAGFI